MLPLTLHHTFHGKFTLGVAVDPGDDLMESNEQNNWDQGPDKLKVKLYDPIAERGLWLGDDGSPLMFGSRNDAKHFLENNGFNKGLDALSFDAGLSRPLTTPTYSFHTGEVMPAAAFRIQAGYKILDATHVEITIQGADTNLNPAHLDQVYGEPSPPYAELHDLSLFFYVKDYHDRF